MYNPNSPTEQTLLDLYRILCRWLVGTNTIQETVAAVREAAKNIPDVQSFD